MSKVWKTYWSGLCTLWKMVLWPESQ